MKRAYTGSTGKNTNNLFVFEQLVDFLQDWNEKFNFTSSSPYCTAAISRFLSTKVSIAILGSNFVTATVAELKSAAASNRLIRESAWASLLSWKSKADYNKQKYKSGSKSSGKRKFGEYGRREGQSGSKPSSKSSSGSQF